MFTIHAILPISHSQVKRNTYAHGLLSKIHVFHIKFHAYYRMVQPKIIYFRCDRKRRSAPILCAFEPLLQLRPLQACFNIETPSLLIVEPLAPARLGINISRITTDTHVVPINARANRVFVRSFSPGQYNRVYVAVNHL
jgi:hypothetical protein